MTNIAVLATFLQRPTSENKNYFSYSYQLADRENYKTEGLDESRHIAFAIYFLSRLVAEHCDEAWNALEARMHELLPLVIETNNLFNEAYANGIPFDLDVNEFNEYSTTQFQKRFDRIQKSRNQSLEEINTIANSLDEVLA